MPPSSQTVVYNTVAALALDKLSPMVADNVSTGTKLFYFMKKSGNWEGIAFGGRQLRGAQVLQQLPVGRRRLVLEVRQHLPAHEGDHHRGPEEAAGAEDEKTGHDVRFTV